MLSRLDLRMEQMVYLIGLTVDKDNFNRANSKSPIPDEGFIPEGIKEKLKALEDEKIRQERAVRAAAVKNADKMIEFLARPRVGKVVESEDY